MSLTTRVTDDDIMTQLCYCGVSIQEKSSHFTSSLFYQVQARTLQSCGAGMSVSHLDLSYQLNPTTRSSSNTVTDRLWFIYSTTTSSLQRERFISVILE